MTIVGAANVVEEFVAGARTAISLRRETADSSFVMALSSLDSVDRGLSEPVLEADLAEHGIGARHERALV